MPLIRSRDGCLTCKRRKKKCDGAKPQCQMCQRLHLICEGYKARLLFEDDPRRESIRRRGPARKEQNVDVSANVQNPQAVSLSHHLEPSAVPELSDADTILWDSYLNRFCKTYTTSTDNSSPFTSIIVPMAMQHDVVKRAVLALAALQLDLQQRPDLRQALKIHHNLAQSAVTMAIQQRAHAFDLDQVLSIGTTSVLLLIASKLSGQSYPVVRSHLANIRHLSARVSFFTGVSRHASTFKVRMVGFWRKMLSYTGVLADLIGARAATGEEDVEELNMKPDTAMVLPSMPRFKELVSRINAAPELVSALDIDQWKGELDFLPSVTNATESGQTVALLADSSDDGTLIREIYRTMLRIQHFKRLRDRSFSSTSFNDHTYTTLAYPPFVAQEYLTRLVRQQIQYMQQLTPESRYETSLVLPIGVTAPEVTSTKDRAWVMNKLKSLQAKLGFPLLRRCQQQLLDKWVRSDEVRANAPTNDTSCNSRVPAMLLWG